MLHTDPQLRLSARDVLAHAWMSDPSTSLTPIEERFAAKKLKVPQLYLSSHLSINHHCAPRWLFLVFQALPLLAMVVFL
jgi:hypothetical protein